MKIDIVGVDHFFTDRIWCHDTNMPGNLILLAGFLSELICERTNLVGIMHEFTTVFCQRDSVIDSLK